MQKIRKQSLVVLIVFGLLLCCTVFMTACGESKVAQSLTISGAPESVTVYDVSKNGSIAEYKEQLLANFSVTLTYTDKSTETFTGLEALNKNKIYLENFLVNVVGTHVVTVYCGKASATFNMTVK